MSVRKLIVQYVGDVLLLPKLERDVMRICERDRISRTVREYAPIVRCRDCKYYDGEPDMESMGEKCWRDPNHTGRSAPTAANGYCWRGERREQ